MRSTIDRSARGRGFSLIEVLIVAAILSILAGVAIINIQQVMDNQRVKATIAEARQIASAVSFVRQDTGFIPKLCYMIEPLIPFAPGTPEGIVYADPVGSANWQVYPDFDYISTSAFIDDPGGNETVKAPHDRRIQKTWDGPYFALSATAKSSVEGPSGFTQVVLPQRGNVRRRWPTDQWGFPYVLYLIETLDPRLVSQGAAAVGNVRFLQTPTKAPDYASSVVSYGEDTLPGLYRRLDPGELARKTTQRLYVVDPGDPSNSTFIMLEADDYDITTPEGRMRLEGYSEERFRGVAGYTGPAAQNLIGVTDVVAIMDGGAWRLQPSDDIIMDF